MWVEQSRDKLRLCERYTDIGGKSHKVSVPLLKDTPKERKKAMAELSQKIESFETDIETIRFDKLVEKYINRKEIKDSTRRTYYHTYRKITEMLGNPVVSAITSQLVKRKLSDADLSVSAYNNYLRNIKGILKYAREYGYTDKEIIVSPLKSDKHIDIEQQYLTAEELLSVLEALEGTPDYYLCKFLALTGCRIGEATALTIEDISEDYISINKTYIFGRVQSPKTATSNRQIYIQKELKDFLNDYLQYRNLRLMANGIRTNLLFFSRTGNHIETNNFASRLKMCKSDKNLHPHIFRHTHASLLAEQGYNLDAISRRLGHSDSGITKKIYLHVTEKVKQRDEEKLKEIRLLS